MEQRLMEAKKAFKKRLNKSTFLPVLLCCPSQFSLSAKHERILGIQIELLPCHYGIGVWIDDHKFALVVDGRLLDAGFFQKPATALPVDEHEPLLPLC